MKKSKLNQVGNLGKAVSFINAQGTVYNPGKDSIQVAALETLLAQAQEAMKAADVSRTAYQQVIVERRLLFQQLPVLARRVVAAAKASGVSDETFANLMELNRRFHSRKSKVVEKKTETTASSDESPEVKFRRKLSRLDFDSKISTFRTLIETVRALKEYRPKEVELKIGTLENFRVALEQTNKTAMAAFAAVSMADNNFNSVLYGPTGIHGRMVEVKAYIESVFGYKSFEHRELIKLKFKKR